MYQRQSLNLRKNHIFKHIIHALKQIIYVSKQTIYIFQTTYSASSCILKKLNILISYMCIEINYVYLYRISYMGTYITKVITYCDVEMPHIFKSRFQAFIDWLQWGAETSNILISTLLTKDPYFIFLK